MPMVYTGPQLEDVHIEGKAVGIGTGSDVINTCRLLSAVKNVRR